MARVALKPAYQDSNFIFALRDGTTEIWARTVKNEEVEIEMWDEKSTPEGSISICLSKHELQLLMRAL